MKSLQWRIAVVLLVALSPLVARARGGGGGGGFISVQVSSGFMGIKGVPLSADTVNESTQTLIDGNRVHHETHGKFFRDSEGRTRNETELGNGDTQIFRIIIQDPVRQVFILLDSPNKTARVQHFPKPPSQSSPVAPAKPPVSPPTESKPVLNTEDLGSKEIEGFTVYGTRRSHTIEAGKEGNDKPITTVNETWYSPDLKTALLTIHEDPRSGQTIMRLTNIHTGDPDPLLFQVPPDYTVKEISNQQ